MKWPPEWLPRRIADWRPTRPQAIAIGAGAAALAVAVTIALIAVSPWSGGGEEEGDSVSGTNTPHPTATTRRTRTPSPTPAVTPTFTPTPAAVTQSPRTPAPTTVPQPGPAGPSASIAQLLAWGGSDPRLTDLRMVPGSSDEAFVSTQQDADIWRVSTSGAHAPVLVGDLSAYVGGGSNEEGLLSLAFSPNFLSDGRLYVYYTRGAPQPTVLARFQVINGTVDSGSQTVILEVPDFASNHNGGRVVFGRDGMLYLSTGDGGGGGDPNENGQNIDSLLGKVLRLNVTRQETYSVPAENPFVGASGLDEIWAYGFRNPWRMSMDSATGDLWVGDVGQSVWEEVGPVVRGGNHGWDCYEGFAVYESTGCQSGGFVSPRAAYGHTGGRCSVTGGYVYRGNGVPSLYGWYVYGDFCSGEIWAVSPAAGDPVLLQDTPYSISAFAELPGGEIAVLTFDRAVYRLVP